jgi:hypothetical protein
MYHQAAWCQQAFPFLAVRSGPDYCSIIGIRTSEIYFRIFFVKYFVEDMILSLQVVISLIKT